MVLVETNWRAFFDIELEILEEDFITDVPSVSITFL
eukprot:CAMPEP_0202473434 /NCGR_PEP_ID=MMETSP1360-20130828/90984_1 /ASSEMBLY_ACC=CAM_ASM_000848 /TAXON_ID=515479 /ORGANISM="Licmophora paradoxa, Strain CCMP2313" /LENGTH=35 /DNA_ID= /DNA_START= /DNA_END= /DNA_ORIENTATION=